MSEDYSQYLDDPRENTVGLGDLQSLAEEQAEAERKVAECEESLRLAKAALRDISEHRLPDALEELGIDEFKTASGISIKVKQTIRASLSKGNEARGVAWLRQNKYDALLKQNVTIPFGKGEEERAKYLQDRLLEDGFNFEEKCTVHPATLSKFVREKLEAGENLPEEILGIYRQRASVISFR